MFANIPKHHLREIGWFTLFFSTLLVVGWSASSLIFGPFVDVHGLLRAYVVLFLSTTVLMHAAIFGFPHVFNFQWPKKTSKFIEYAYLLTLGLGLLHVTFYAPTFLTYVTHMAGNEDLIVEHIYDQAKVHIEESCEKPDPRLGSRFTPEYCKKLKRIVGAQDLKRYVSASLSRDSEFLDHVIYMYAGPSGVVSVHSPIRGLVQNFLSIKSLEAFEIDTVSKDFWSWIGIILLPLGLALRISKTSMETFLS